MEPTSIVTCSLCGHQITDPSDRARGMCDDCRVSTGLTGPVSALRPQAPCRRCNHTQLVRAVLRERTVAAHGGERLAPSAVTFGLDKQTSFFLLETTVRAKPDQTFGMLVAHICRGCGFTEIYTAGFADLPIGPEHGTELVDVAPRGPDATPFR